MIGVKMSGHAMGRYALASPMGWGPEYRMVVADTRVCGGSRED